jgi:thioredoxin-related protein
MISRRGVMMAAGGVAAAMAMGRRSRAAAILTEDGLYREPWFIESFLELADDLETAAKAGKRFAILWELKGCPYCRETHLVNFAQKRIADYIRSNFDILQLNIIGARRVTDFDGTVISEKAIARKYGVRGTPTFQFFPETSNGLKDKSPDKREIARMAGYVMPDDFLALFRFVREKAYEHETFGDYLKARG